MKPAKFAQLARSGLMSFGLLLLSSLSAHAVEPVTFFLEDEPIYTSSNPQSPGFLQEIVMEMAKEMKLQPKVSFLPWKRAQLMTINTPNAVIFPLARTSTREPKYTWICKIFDVPVMFITKADNPKIDSIEQAKALRGIGVITGTPQEEWLKNAGLTYVSLTGKQLYAALESNEVKAIYTAKPEAVLGWHDAGYPEKLQFGQPLQTLPLWIAANKHSDEVDVEKWNAALETVKKSGFFERMTEKYFGK